MRTSVAHPNMAASRVALAALLALSLWLAVLVEKTAAAKAAATAGGGQGEEGGGGADGGAGEGLEPGMHAMLHGLGKAPNETHVLLATYHHTGHTTPVMVLAKALAEHGFRVSVAVLDLARSQVKDRMEAVGVEYIGAGDTPWDMKEDKRMTAELFDSMDMSKNMPIMKNMFQNYEENHLLGLEEHYSSRPLPDLMVIDVMNSGGFDFAFKYNIPHVALQTSGLPMMHQVESFFVPVPSHHGVMFFPREHLTKTWERVANWYSSRLLMLWFGRMSAGITSDVRARNNVPDAPTNARRYNFPPPVIVCTTWGAALPQSVPPYVVPVGALYDPAISPSPPLDGAVRQWLDDALAEHVPVVFVSMGTNARLPPDQLAVLVEAMEMVPHRFVWSLRSHLYEAVPEMPRNVMHVEFVAQNELLAHPATAVFLSHCGQNSMLEAIVNGVPLLGIGFIGDQPTNAARMDDNGAGIALDRHSMTSTQVADALRALVDDPSYKHGMERMRVLLEQGGGAHRAVALIETGVRYGFRHLYPVYLFSPWYQYYDVDIYAANTLVVGTVLALVYLVYRVACCFCRCCCRRRSSKAKTD
eukprot:TRINITY_DN20773_c0_g1_i1.p1 TRINITY_DN20773_c0_g1~~TRINITY_DN20773_c0_g1_i1.p1  ORF type:complete len:585 (+),score=203.87 TRINITY_DN20773_c0_g1_i1:2-1756(+)